jgi:hypothetical protein
MAYKIIVDPAASFDIIESIEWYNKVRPGLGLKFYKQIQAVFKIIRKNPSAFTIRYKTSRTAPVKKFPLWFIISLTTKRNPSL